METNALLFAICREQESLALFEKAFREAGLPAEQERYFFRHYTATSEQRIDRMVAIQFGAVFGAFEVFPPRAGSGKF